MMKYTLDRELWKAVESFEIDEVKEGRGPERAFEARLAEEQGWSRGFASRVVGEYRKFVYLAAVGGHPVTPSEAIDEAWHLHLMYTRSYWARLCGGVLKKPLHHEPSRGGGREEKKFEDWYVRTLEMYREVFGEEAPGDVWPRGGKKEEAESRRKKKALATAGILGVVAVLSGGCMAATGVRGGFDPWTVLVVIAVLVASLCLVAAVAKSRGNGVDSARRRDDGSGCGATTAMYGGDDSDGHHGHHEGHHGGHHGDAGQGSDAGGHGDSGATGSDGGGASCGSSGGDGGGSSCGSSGCGGGGCGGS